MGQTQGVVRITVPGQPVAKGRPRACVRGGRVATYTPDKTARYENLVRLAAQEAMAGRMPIAGAVALEVKAFLAVPASWSKKKQAAALADLVRPTVRPDGDNILKAICDGMNGVVYGDDAHITTALMAKRYAAVPRVEVRAWQEAQGAK